MTDENEFITQPVVIPALDIDLNTQPVVISGPITTKAAYDPTSELRFLRKQDGSVVLQQKWTRFFPDQGHYEWRPVPWAEEPASPNKDGVQGWQITETEFGKVARLVLGEFKADVSDLGANGSHWFVMLGDTPIAAGSIYEANALTAAMDKASAAIGANIPS